MRNEVSDPAREALPDPDFVLDENPPGDLTIHTYPLWPPYKKTTSAFAQPGDVALCGFVKRLPSNGPRYRDMVNCPDCCRLRELGLGNPSFRDRFRARRQVRS